MTGELEMLLDPDGPGQSDEHPRGKVSLTTPNPANLVAAHIRETWPELAQNPIPGLWFTGSRVWNFAYGTPLSADADWDLFSLHLQAIDAVVARLELTEHPSCRTAAKHAPDARSIDSARIPVNPGSYEDGYSYETPRGVVDLWLAKDGSAYAELESYPQRSHAHCRVAFSFTEGLLMLPNEVADTGDAHIEEDPG